MVAITVVKRDTPATTISATLDLAAFGFSGTLYSVCTVPDATHPKSKCTGTYPENAVKVKVELSAHQVALLQIRSANHTIARTD